MKFPNKIAVVTGAIKGIGKATALELANNGATIILLDKDTASAEDTLKEIKETSNASMFFETDISKLSSIQDTKQKIQNLFGQIDILIANAGIISQPCSIEEANENSIDKTINTNFKGTYWTIKILGELVKNNGSIVTTSSIDGIIGEPFAAIYSGTKAAIISLTKSFARYYAEKEIRVNSVAPGLIDTPLTQSSGENPDDTINYSLIKRIGTPEDIAKAIAFLASEDASFITGQVLIVDGGFTLK